MPSIADTTVEGGNIKAYIRLTYPCALIEDVHQPSLDPPTIAQVAAAISRHRQECAECE